MADTLSFHVVARGCAFVEVDGPGGAGGPDVVRLDAGQLALVPRGLGHRVSTSPGARALGRADELPQTMLGDAFSL
ncbi:MAG: cupin domain-containing protein, partial [Dermatophilaceae bacterium]